MLVLATIRYVLSIFNFKVDYSLHLEVKIIKKIERKTMLLLSLKQRQCPIAHLVAWLPPYLGCGFEHGHNQNSLFTTNERILTSGRNLKSMSKQKSWSPLLWKHLKSMQGKQYISISISKGVINYFFIIESVQFET